MIFDHYVNKKAPQLWRYQYLICKILIVKNAI